MLSPEVLKGLICLDAPGLITGRIINVTKKLKTNLPLTPTVIDVLLLKCTGCIPAERRSSLRRPNFNRSGHNSFNTWRAEGKGSAERGEEVVVTGGGGEVTARTRSKTVTSFARVLGNVNRQLNAR